MNQVEQTVTCPYCWQLIDILVDTSVSNQEYIEDCQVCCRPIFFQVAAESPQQVSIIVKSEND